MLILTRKANESIIIGDNIRVTVIEIQGDKVRLGIDAPRELSVHRQEIYEAIKEANRRAVLDGRGLEELLRQVNLEAGKKGGD